MLVTQSRIEDGQREGRTGGGMDGGGGDTVKTRACRLTWTYSIGTRENNITALLATKSKV